MLAVSVRDSRRRGGFTLIEMLIVITIIAILALIVIPRIMQAGRKARESTLRSQLRQIRDALQFFEADTGVVPGTLYDLVAPDETSLSAVVPPGTYKGPYLFPQAGINGSGIPLNPFGPTPTGASADVDAHWTYSGGVLISAVNGITLDGIPFSNL